MDSTHCQKNLMFILSLLLPISIQSLLPIHVTRSTRIKPSIVSARYESSTPKISSNDFQSISPEQESSHANITFTFDPLFRQAFRATTPKGQLTVKGAHDSFRYEWGTWVDESVMEELMRLVDQIRIQPGAFENLYQNHPSSVDALKSEEKIPVSYRLANGKQWECILHGLPENANRETRHPTGSWSILKALTGVVEVAMLRPDRDGNMKKAIKKDLRGGSDGSFGIGGGGAISGADCIKYVGGPPRSYMGKSDRTILLEIVIRPPIAVEEAVESMETWDDLESVLEVVDIPEEDDVDEPNEEDIQSVNVHQSAQHQAQNLGSKLGMNFEKVGGLDDQLDAIVRRVLASRANPIAASRLGVSHVRGILLSGPPGCGKTLLARELARLLGAREPQIVNGPEILDKFIGEAEKRVRDLFVPAEMEWAQVGKESALHIIILDEMDAIARKRGSVSSDTTGVRDSVVNQLLAKMDGVKEANNVLVVGLTNRPELLDPALLRPGRLEVKLRVELPDLKGRRDILRIHTRQMKEAGGLSRDAEHLIEDLSDVGLAAKSDKFTGAEIAGLVRSAASFALARSVEGIDNVETNGAEEKSFLDQEEGKVSVADFQQALGEVLPSLGKQDKLLQMRFSRGISPCSPSMKRIMRDLTRFTTPVVTQTPRLYSLLLVGAGNGGSGVTALAAWIASEASKKGTADYVRLVTALDLLTDSSSGGEGARAAALVDRVSEAREMPNSLLVLDDVDQLCAGSGPGGYSSVMIATLRAALRLPPESSHSTKAGGQSSPQSDRGRSIHIIATTSRSDAACKILPELFEETIVVPLLTEVNSIEQLLLHGGINEDFAKPMASLINGRLESVGCKEVMRLVEQAVAVGVDRSINQVKALEEILEDIYVDNMSSSSLCKLD